MENEVIVPPVSEPEIEERVKFRPTLVIAGCCLAVVVVLVALRMIERSQPKPSAVVPPKIVAPPVGQCLGEGLHVAIKNQIYYQYGDDCFYVYKGDADPATFQVLGKGFARDAKYVYYQGRSFNVSDLKSLEVIDETHARDKQHVYDLGMSSDARIVTGADPASFEVLNDAYGRDKNSGFLSGAPIKGSHGPSFEVVSEITTSARMFYAKDRSRVYLHSNVVEGADPATFRPYPEFSGVSRDATQVFVDGFLVKNADPESFGLMWEGKRSLECQTAYRDKTRVFLGSAELEGADPESFRYIGVLPVAPFLYTSSCVTADAKHVYVDHELTTLDAATVEILGAYVKDAKSVYFGMNKVEGAEPKTFMVLEGSNAQAIYMSAANG